MIEKNRTVILKAIAFFAAIAAVLAGFAAIGIKMEDSALKPETRGTVKDGSEVSGIMVNGTEYRPKSMTTILLMGIDRSGDSGAIGFRNGGQADFLDLIAVDSNSKTIYSLPIDRDTMTSIQVLSVLGKESGTRVAQINLSHGFGDGKEQSCRLTVRAVSELMLGVEIDDYIALNLDGIASLNDLIGGITVTLEDDFSRFDPTMTPGTTLTLCGVQAEYYVRSRMSVGIGTNEARMARQNHYVSAMADALKARMESISEVLRLLEGLQPYLLTSMSRGLFANRVWEMRDYVLKTVQIPGTHRTGSDGFVEFYPDTERLQEIVLELFYDRV